MVNLKKMNPVQLAVVIREGTRDMAAGTNTTSTAGVVKAAWAQLAKKAPAVASSLQTCAAAGLLA